MTLTRLDQLEQAIASLPPEKQAEILAQAIVTAKIVTEMQRPKMTRANTTSELLSNWLKKKSNETERAYVNDITHFAQWMLGGKPHLDELELTEVMVEDCDRYLSWLLELEADKLITRATVRRRIASLKSFLKYAQDTGFAQFNAASKTKMPKARKTAEERVLSVGDVGAMLNEAKKAVKVAETELVKQQATRDWLLIKLLYIGAFRVGEISTLTWEQITVTQTGNGCIKVVGKGDKQRKVIIPANHLIHLQSSRLSKIPKEPVFKSREGGKAICDRTIRRIVVKYAKLAKLDRIPSPHWLRHSHATHALKNQAPIKVTTNTLGHASASTLLDNYVHVGEEESSSFFVNAD
ncbi:tyrosine-type recombinase/integrase [Tolypothrix sp. VBCCA 56010]|uniref:tyrosine-type recombinase/integrase n=1 Tax=Tolypothrix sp. VBCCA 56010 TaxID=3137731 RepID=UPI003D7C578A